jgi:hypothetical protein
LRSDFVRKRGFLRHVLQYVSHFAVYPLMLLPCSVAGIHFLFPWLFIVQSGVSQGCLNGSAGNYTLTSSTGSTYQLTGSTDELAQHVNQQVRLKGTPIAVSASASTSPSGTSGSSTPSSSTNSSTPTSSSSSQQSFTVSKVTKISDTCSTSYK